MSSEKENAPTDLEYIVAQARHFEQILKNQFGATGRGLGEYTTSIEERIPVLLVRALFEFASRRNRVVHGDSRLKSRRDTERLCADIDHDLRLLLSSDIAQPTHQDPIPLSIPIDLTNAISLPEGIRFKRAQRPLCLEGMLARPIDIYKLYKTTCYTLDDLARSLPFLPYDFWSMHVHDRPYEKNDFAEWIDVEFGYEELADELRAITLMSGVNWDTNYL